MEDRATSTSRTGEMRPRRVRISSQMQVRIPAEFYHALGFGSEAICVATKTGVEFRPVRSAIEQSADIILELSNKGLTGIELANEFTRLAHNAINNPVSADDFEIEGDQIDLRERDNEDK